MSEQVIIVCPHCSYFKALPKAALPEGASRATCPKCRHPFPLTPETLQRGRMTEHPAAQEQSAPLETAPTPPPPPEPPAIQSVAAVSPDPVPTPQAALPPRTLAFAFTGTARDYFGIWIVNTLLKMLTAGIYSAWAKVRMRRFFYGSTTLDNHPFEYLADPMALFKGWLIAAAAFVLYAIGSRVSPILSLTVALIVFLAFPWLVVRSRIFNAANSTYRNIRFSFSPEYRKAYEVYAGLSLLSMLTLGILSPYAIYRQKKFTVENSSYGTTTFTFTASAKDFYLLFLRVILGVVIIIALFAIMAGLEGSGLASAGAASGTRTSLGGLALIPVLTLPVVYFLTIIYAQTAMANLSWNSTRLGDGRFQSTLRTRDMAWLIFSSGVAILCSLGLLMPWATVRLARYRFENLTLITGDGLEHVVAASAGTAVGATGEEIGDVFDMPIDIAL